MKRKGTSILVGAVLAVGLAVVGYALWPRSAAPTSVATDASAERTGERGVTGRKPSPRTSHAPRVGPLRPRPPKPVFNDADEDEDDARTPAERALSKRIEQALDDEKLEDALACAKEALRCGNAEVRQEMVDALGWFGAAALPELTPFLADPDEDVRESAMNEWSMAVSEIENETEKIGIVEVAMSILTDEDGLEEISGEYIGIDEKLAVESLVRIVAANGSKEGVAKAKETYEFVTGEEWTSAEAARKWIAEEYEPPEK